MALGIKKYGGKELLEGIETEESGVAAHAEGYGSIAKGKGSHAEGGRDDDRQIGPSTASADYSHAEGVGSEASAYAAHAENIGKASGEYSHAENTGESKGNYSHAEGIGHTEITGVYSHAEGSATSSNTYSHAEGDETQASGKGSHSEGKNSHAIGEASHSEGYGTIAAGAYQHVEGRWNIEDPAINEDGTGKYVHIVGNGTDSDPTKRKNIYTLDWDGTAWFAKNVVIGEVIEFSNGVKLKPLGESGLEIILINPGGEEEPYTLFQDGILYSSEAFYAWMAGSDDQGNIFSEHYATKEEVDTKIQNYINEAILGGAW